MRTVQLVCSTLCRPAGSPHLPRLLSAEDNLPVTTPCCIYCYSVSNECQTRYKAIARRVAWLSVQCRQCASGARHIQLSSDCCGRERRERCDRAAIRRGQAEFKVPLNGQWQSKEWAVLPACNGAGRTGAHSRGRRTGQCVLKPCKCKLTALECCSQAIEEKVEGLPAVGSSSRHRSSALRQPPAGLEQLNLHSLAARRAAQLCHRTLTHAAAAQEELPQQR